MADVRVTERNGSRMELLALLIGQRDRFIHTICKPEDLPSGSPFSGDLGRYTPCFIDLGLIGKSLVLEGPVVTSSYKAPTVY